MHRVHHGFTLIEALVVMGIVSLLASLALPRFGDFIDNQRADAALCRLQTALAGARIHAVTHVTATMLCPAAGNGACRDDSDWSGGWLLFESRGDATQPKDAQAILADDSAPLRGGLRLVSTNGRKRVRFTADGRSAGSNVSFTLCKGSTALGAVVVNNAGRARSEKPGDSSHCQG